MLGYDTLADYLKATPYFGCIVGRCGNRIAQSGFSPQREPPTSWRPTTAPIPSTAACVDLTKSSGMPGPRSQQMAWPLELVNTSPDGEEGFPGNLKVKAVYSLKSDGGLHLDFTATTDGDTVSISRDHSYFSLAGAVTSSVTPCKSRVTKSLPLTPP